MGALSGLQTHLTSLGLAWALPELVSGSLPVTCAHGLCHSRLIGVWGTSGYGRDTRMQYVSHHMVRHSDEWTDDPRMIHGRQGPLAWLQTKV